MRTYWARHRRVAMATTPHEAKRYADWHRINRDCALRKMRDPNYDTEVDGDYAFDGKDLARKIRAGRGRYFTYSEFVPGDQS